MKYSYLIILVVLVSMTSCDSSRVYEEFNDMDEAFWHLDSTQTFDFPIEDPSRAYNLAATFRNASSYPFYNLYFQYTIKDSVQNVLKEELKEVNLFDPKTGEPFGEGLGDLFDHVFILEEGYQFPERGVYSIEMKQFMRMDTLPFILSVGARVEFTQ